METLEILFNPITLCVIIFITGLGFLASPYEIKYEDDEDLMM
jgi:hypothetical protein